MRYSSTAVFAPHGFGPIDSLNAVPSPSGGTVFRSIAVQNFRVHKSTTAHLGRWTVLYGSNGGGKSSLLDALNLASSIIGGAQLWRLFQGVYSLERQMHDPGLNSMEFSIEHSIEYPHGLAPCQVSYVVCLTQIRGRATIDSERLSVDGTIVHESNGPASTVLRSDTVDPEVLNYLRQVHANVRRYRLFPDALRERSDSTMHFIKKDGEGLPSALSFERADNAACVAAVISSLRRVDTTIGDVRTVAGGSGDIELEFDSSAGSPLSAVFLSDGQALALGTLWLGMTPRGPRLLMIDEPETSLSPVAIGEMLRSLDESLPASTQVIVTTHSPFVMKWALNSDQQDLQVRPDFGTRTWREALRAQAIDPDTIHNGHGVLASTTSCCALLESWLSG